MRVIDGSGRLLDASYVVERDIDCLALIMESRSGKSKAGPGRNSEYNDCLNILLTRLGSLGAILLDALVDSRKTQELDLPESERRLIATPVQLAQEHDIDGLRRRMGTAQAKIGQIPGAIKGGNSTKRIRLRLDVPGYQLSQAAHLAETLAAPVQELRTTPLAILERLRPVDDHLPTDEGYARAIAELDGDFDRAVTAIRRIEQSYLRRTLFLEPISSCDLCGRRFEIEFLVAAHIKKRSACSNSERRDISHIVMSACRFGCDELFERGYVSVAEDGALVLSPDLQPCDQANAYALEYLDGRRFGRPMYGRSDYFAWHRGNTFRG